MLLASPAIMLIPQKTRSRASIFETKGRVEGIARARATTGRDVGLAPSLVNWRAGQSEGEGSAGRRVGQSATGGASAAGGGADQMARRRQLSAFSKLSP